MCDACAGVQVMVRPEEWMALARSLCSLVSIHVCKGQFYLFSCHIKANADALLPLAALARPLLRYDEWNDRRALRCIDVRASPLAAFTPDASLEQQRTAALALAKLILRRAGHPCTASDHFLTIAPFTRIKTQRYLLSSSLDLAISFTRPPPSTAPMLPGLGSSSPLLANVDFHPPVATHLAVHAAHGAHSRHTSALAAGSVLLPFPQPDDSPISVLAAAAVGTAAVAPLDAAPVSAVAARATALDTTALDTTALDTTALDTTALDAVVVPASSIMAASTATQRADAFHCRPSALLCATTPVSTSQEDSLPSPK